MSFDEFGKIAPHFAREKLTNVSPEAQHFERFTVILLKFNCTQTIKEEFVQMCCFLRLFLPHSFSNQSENCLTDSGSKCLLHVTQEENCPVKVLVLVIFSQSSESRFIIRCCQFNVIKICVTNKKRQYIKEYVRRPSNEV